LGYPSHPDATMKRKELEEIVKIVD
jgi:hypothetical protein